MTRSVSWQGIPKLMPITEEEKGMVKQPEQFKNFFKEGEPLSEELGERMARWAAGSEKTSQPKAFPSFDTLLTLYANCQTDADFQAAEKIRERDWKSFTGKGQREQLKTASAAAQERLLAPPVEGENDQFDPALFDDKPETVGGH